MKVRKFKKDEWVGYCQFLDSSVESLRNERKRSVILEALPQEDFYDYEIYIDDEGSQTVTIKKVKEENLFYIESK